MACEIRFFFTTHGAYLKQRLVLLLVIGALYYEYKSIMYKKISNTTYRAKPMNPLSGRTPHTTPRMTPII